MDLFTGARAKWERFEDIIMNRFEMKILQTPCYALQRNNRLTGSLSDNDLEAVCPMPHGNKAYGDRDRSRYVVERD